MKAFITGINGFAGRHLADCLLKKGFEVFGIDRRGDGVKGCNVEGCDILDKGSVASAIRKSKPEAIFHLAALSSVRQSFSNPEATKKVSVEGTRNLFDAVIAAGAVVTKDIPPASVAAGVPARVIKFIEE